MSIARIKKNDTVIVITGADKGKTGKVLSVSPSKGTALVEGVRLVKKAVRRDERNPQGGFVDREMPIELSKLMPYDADKKRGSRIARTENNGKTVRVLKTSGKVMD